MCWYTFLVGVSVVLLFSVGSSQQAPIPVSGVPRCGPWHGNYSCPDRINASGISIGTQFCSKWGFCGMTANYSVSEAAGIFLSESLSCELDSECAGVQVCDPLENKCSYAAVDAAYFLPTYQLLEDATTAVSTSAPTLSPTDSPGGSGNSSDSGKGSDSGNGSGDGSGDESVVDSPAVYAVSSQSQLAITLLVSSAIFL